MSVLGGAVIACTALAGIGIAGSVFLEAFEMKKTRTFRYLLTDTFILFAFGGLLIAVGYFFCFWDLHTKYEESGINWVSHCRKGVGLAWGVFLCGASVYILTMWKKHRGGQTTLQTETLSVSTETPVAKTPATEQAPKPTLKESFTNNLSRLKSFSSEVRQKINFPFKRKK